MTNEAVEGVRVVGRRVGLEPVRGGVVLDDGLHAAVVALVSVRNDDRSAKGGERDEHDRTERGSPDPEPTQHVG